MACSLGPRDVRNPCIQARYRSHLQLAISWAQRPIIERSASKLGDNAVISFDIGMFAIGGAGVSGLRCCFAGKPLLFSLVHDPD
jgi:hypothetical protein